MHGETLKNIETAVVIFSSPVE